MLKKVAPTELSNREFFIRCWSQESSAFLDVCKALRADRLDYRPHPASRSAGELVALRVAVEAHCVYLCAIGPASFASSLNLHPASKTGPLQEMIAAYERSHQSLADALSRLSDETWNRPAWLMKGRQEMVLKSTVGGLLWIALLDAVHQRGQLSTYSYGDMALAPQFWMGQPLRNVDVQSILRDAHVKAARLVQVLHPMGSKAPGMYGPSADVPAR